MNFLLMTIGSHGDVHPFVGVAKALKARRHRVWLAVNEAFEEMVRRAGIEYVQLGTRDVFERVQRDPTVWHPQKGPGVVLGHVARTLREVYDITIQNADRNTLIVGSSLCLGARVASDKHALPMATIHLSPICIRSCERLPAMPGGGDANWLPKFIRPLLWSAADRWVINPVILPSLNALRSELGLSPVKSIQGGYWNAPLRTIGLWPEWFCPMLRDYPPQVRLAGFPLYDEGDQVPPDSDLIAWLGQGDAPIAFTPGSANVFGHGFFEAAVEACVRLKRRGILLTRHAEQVPKDLPESVRHVPFAPFSALLPHCAAIVHHGGVGTMAQALRAGVPQLMMPMSHDQFDNAAICRKLGVADAIPARRFRGPRVADRLAGLISSDAVRAACDTIARRSAADHPTERVCALLEDVAPNP